MESETGIQIDICKWFLAVSMHLMNYMFIVPWFYIFPYFLHVQKRNTHTQSLFAGKMPSNNPKSLVSSPPKWWEFGFPNLKYLEVNCLAWHLRCHDLPLTRWMSLSMAALFKKTVADGRWMEDGGIWFLQSFVWDIFWLQWSVLPTWFSKTLHSWPNAKLCQNDVSERLLYIVYLFDLFVLHSYLITAYNSHLHGVDYVLVLFLPMALQRCAAGGEASTNTNHSWGVIDNGTPQGRC